jgi:type IV secretion system protein VirD4
MIVIFICVVALLVLVLPKGKDVPGHTYRAEFGDGSKYISGWNHGFAVSGNKFLTKKDSYTNMAVFGPTGSGKSSVVIYNCAESLSRGGSSVVYFDVSGEGCKVMSGYHAMKKYRMLNVDFGTGNYECFNPLARCKTVADIQKVAHLIVINSMGESKSEIFWNRSSEMIISLFARYLIFHGAEEQRNIYNVLRMVQRFVTEPEAVDMLMLRTKDEDLIDSYKATIAMGERTLQSVVASVRAALNLWADEAVIRSTSTDSIDFSLLRREKVCLFVTVPLKDLAYYKPLSALFFQCLFNELMSHLPTNEEGSVFVVLDEAASMRFSNLSVTVSNIRKYKAGIVLCMQDEQALTALYGAAEANQIKTNCGCQVYLKGQPLHTCLELSKIIGKKTFDTEKGQVTRELMTSDEIRLSDNAIVLFQNAPALLLEVVPYYERFWTRVGKIPPYEFPKRANPEPSRIQFPTS